MKFALGYRESENGEPFHRIVEDYREHLSEVYFSWPGTASGRPDFPGCSLEESRETMTGELVRIRNSGIVLDLLFNANCYGADAVGGRLEREVHDILNTLDRSGVPPGIVTTTSLFVAHILKRNYPEIEVRASVNMRLDSTGALEYLGNLFDSFYLRRDLQRDLKTVRMFSGWSRKHGKKMCMLANSGCLRNCPAQTFHDNIVAHLSEIRNSGEAPLFPPCLCRNLFGDPARLVEFLKASWIRPEDLREYAPYFSVVKLATREHSNPRQVIHAYAEQKFSGNLLDLTEPCFSPVTAPLQLKNERFPPEWKNIAGKCATNCTHCGKCDEVLKLILVT